MSRPANKEYEMRNVNEPYRGERPRTSSAAALHFQQLKQIQQNEVAAERARRSSRVSKGLPESARPKKVYVGTPALTQRSPRTKRSSESARPTRRPGRSRIWMSTRSRWRSWSTGSGPT